MISTGKASRRAASATTYWPQVPASEAIALTNFRYATHTRTAADATTAQCTVTAGLAYMPVPASSGEGLAGLLAGHAQGVVTAQQTHRRRARVATARLRTEVPLRSVPSPVEAGAKG
jgi:hypothetical protein